MSKLSPTCEPASVPAPMAYDLPRLEQYTLISKGNLEYRVIVCRPDEPPGPAGYPVVYVIDGNAWTAIISEVIRVSKVWATQGRLEPTVVVGIGYPTQEAFDIERRFYDLTTPWPDSRMLRAVGWANYKLGGADNFLEFIQLRLKPEIEGLFHIDRTRQVLFGHSLGGLFALRTLFLHSDAFRSYIAVSPIIFWNDCALLKDEQQCKPTVQRAFVAVGDREQNLRKSEIDRLRQQFMTVTPLKGQDAENGFREAMEVLNEARYVDNAREISKRLSALAIETEFVNFLGEDHFSVVPAAISRSLPFALR